MSLCNPEDGFENYLSFTEPPYLYHLIPKPLTSYFTRNSENLLPIKANHSFFKNTFFSSAIIEWNKLDPNIHCSFSYKIFRKRILEFIRPQPSNIFDVHNSLGLTYLTSLHVGLSHLREHKFPHDFRNSLNPICNCSSSIESTKHYLLQCSNFKHERQTLLQNVKNVNPNLLSMNEDALTHVLLYGNNTLTDNPNTFLLNSVIEYIASTKNFNESLIVYYKK